MLSKLPELVYAAQQARYNAELDAMLTRAEQQVSLAIGWAQWVRRIRSEAYQIRQIGSPPCIGWDEDKISRWFWIPCEVRTKRVRVSPQLFCWLSWRSRFFERYIRLLGLEICWIPWMAGRLLWYFNVTWIIRGVAWDDPVWIIRGVAWDDPVWIIRGVALSLRTHDTRKYTLHHKVDLTSHEQGENKLL